MAVFHGGRRLRGELQWWSFMEVYVFVVILSTFLSLCSSSSSSSSSVSLRFWNSSEEISTLSATLARLGFIHLALMSDYMSPALLGPVTVFAPPESLVARCLSCSLGLVFRAHTVRGLHPAFSLLSDGYELETVIPGRCLTVVADSTIGAAQITHPNLFVSDQIIVHGLLGFVSPHTCSVLPSRQLRSTRFTSPLHDTVFVVTLDGILSLVEMKSQKIMWSIQTGHPIYSSYQSPEISDDSYVDFGNDWVLYRFDRSRGVIERLKSAKDLIRETNQLSKIGVTVVGQMGTSVFVVQAKTGKISRVFRIGSGIDIGENLILIGDEGIDEISITRIDYSFVAYSTFSGNVLWSISLSEFELNSKTKPPVFRIRERLSPNMSFSPLFLSSPSFARVLGLPFLFGFLLVGSACLFCIVLKRKHKKIEALKPKPTRSKKKRAKKPRSAQVVQKLPKQVGKLYVSDEVIAMGSNGTMVFKGSYELRPVAIKRFLRDYYEYAEREIKNLTFSDQNSNIIRYFGVEKDDFFIYLALEQCNFSLRDLVEVGDEDLWKANAYPSSQLQKLMRDIVSGVAHLHKHNFIHRDLKPQNVLLIKDEKEFCAKLADMGISKRLVEGKSSLTHATGSGSSGWRAPEQLCEDRLARVETRAVDLFTLGLVLFYCLTKGNHPFGEDIEQDVNIKNNQVDLRSVEDVPEAVDLLTALLDPNPELRPAAEEVMHHPLFWDSEMRLSFFKDVSACLELEKYEIWNHLKIRSHILDDIEANNALYLWWDNMVDNQLLPQPGSHTSVVVKKYKYDKVTDLVRLIRNTAHHYDQLLNASQVLGSHCLGVDDYFRRTFPSLLIDVYRVIKIHCKGDERFSRYFN